MIKIIYQDADVLVVDKPAGLLVHRSPVDSHAQAFLLQQLREQTGQWLYPVHRLDRPTSGIIVFACHPAAAHCLGAQFATEQVRKTYLALVRGWAISGLIDYPLRTLDGVTGKAQTAVQAAQSRVRLLMRYELPIAHSRHATSRVSLLALRPHTGRRHQLRRHLKHVFHPIVGDSTYGDLKQNRAFAAFTGVQRLLLHAQSLAFVHPDGTRRYYRSAGEVGFAVLLQKIDKYRVFLP